MAAGCHPPKAGNLGDAVELDCRFRGNETGELVKIDVKPQRSITLRMPKATRLLTSPRWER